jgi:hypothetical protein
MTKEDIVKEIAWLAWKSAHSQIIGVAQRISMINL